MLNSTKELLEKFYEPYNARLADILGREWEGVWMYKQNTGADIEV